MATPHSSGGDEIGPEPPDEWDVSEKDWVGEGETSAGDEGKSVLSKVKNW